MRHYAGLDVSTHSTAICIVDETGRVVHQCETTTSPEDISRELCKSGHILEKVALESGGLSHWLLAELRNLALPVICIDSRKMSKLLSININKTDKNDAKLIAEAIRCGFYSEVAAKEQLTAEIAVLLGARKTLQESLVRLKNTVRGHLKTFGIRLGTVSHKKFESVVKEAIAKLSSIVQVSIISLLNAYTISFHEFRRLEEQICTLASYNEDVALLNTIPGIGVISAYTFLVHIGDPSRFKHSRSVGAYFGMTPTQYSSGETKRQGKVSKCGAMQVRTVLNDAATVLLYCTKSWSTLKAWGLKIRRKKGHKKATMALGRKLCVIMHSMLISRKPFEYGTQPQKQSKEPVQLEKKNKEPTLDKVV